MKNPGRENPGRELDRTRLTLQKIDLQPTSACAGMHILPPSLRWPTRKARLGRRSMKGPPSTGVNGMNRACKATLPVSFCYLKEWSQWPGLNRRPTVYETVALPLSYIGVRCRAQWAAPGSCTPQPPEGHVTAPASPGYQAPPSSRRLHQDPVIDDGNRKPDSPALVKFKKGKRRGPAADCGRDG
jgi:hypothetical protein